MKRNSVRHKSVVPYKPSQAIRRIAGRQTAEIKLFKEKRMKKKNGSLLFLAGFIFLIVCGCVSMGFITIEDIESGKAFRKVYYGFNASSIPIEQQSIVVNLCDYQSGSKQFSNPNYNPRVALDLTKNPMYVTKEYEINFNVRGIDGKGFGEATSSGTFDFLDLYDIVIIPPGKYTFNVYGNMTIAGAAGGLKSDDCSENLLPGKIYFLTATGNVTSTLVAFNPFYFTGMSASIKIADPAQKISLRGSTKRIDTTLESVIRGINAKLGRTNNQ
jgi:hypothetical protein